MDLFNTSPYSSIQTAEGTQQVPYNSSWSRLTTPDLCPVPGPGLYLLCSWHRGHQVHWARCLFTVISISGFPDCLSQDTSFKFWPKSCARPLTGHQRGIRGPTPVAAPGSHGLCVHWETYTHLSVSCVIFCSPHGSQICDLTWKEGRHGLRKAGAHCGLTAQVWWKRI